VSVIKYNTYNEYVERGQDLEKRRKEYDEVYICYQSTALINIYKIITPTRFGY